MELKTSPLSELSDSQIKFLHKHKLSEDQLQIALAVDAEARRQGVNPEFVWPMVYQESKFQQNTKSPKGAVGVMQLMPDTANGLKVDADDMAQNISGGVSLLKELMSNPKIGNDPYKVLAGYNASTETRNKFYESGDLADLKDETIKHMYMVGKHYGGDLPSVSYTAPEAPQTDAVEPAEPAASAASSEQAEEPSGPVATPRLPRVVAGLAGAGAGATYGGAAAKTAAEVKAATDIGQKLFPNFKQLVQGKSPIEVLTTLLSTKGPTDQAAAPATTAQPETPQAKSSGEKWGKNWGGFEAKPGASVPEASNQYNRMMPQGKVTKGLAKKFGATLPLAGQNLPYAPTEEELIQVGRLAREARYQDYLNAKNVGPVVDNAPKSTLGQLANKAGEYLKYAKYPVLGGIHGFNIGQGTADVLNRLSENKPGEAALSATGTAAGSAALHAAPLYSAPLAGAASIIPAYLYTRDHPSAEPQAIIKEIREKGGTPSPLDYVFMPGYIGAKAARGE